MERSVIWDRSPGIASALHAGCDLLAGCQLLLRRNFAERIDDAVDHFLDQNGVIALARDPNDRLGAGWPHDQPTVTIESLLGIGDRRANAGMLVRPPAAIAHILGHLRKCFESMAEPRHRLILLLDNREQLQRCNKPV